MEDKTRIAPPQKAVAVKYDPMDTAPRVVAKGAGHVAERILEKGHAGGVPVYKDKKLVEDLTRLDLNETIPAELYEVVAQVLLFISDLDKLEGIRRSAGRLT